MSENQQTELTYTELRIFGQINITFTKICPDSSGTRKKQKEEKKGISIVAFFSSRDIEKIRKSIITKIHDLHYGFVPTRKLHCTFLSLSTKETFQEPNDHYTELMNEQIEIFLSNRKKCQDHNHKIELNFDEVRPGTWYGQNRYPIPKASDGTVVAIGKPCIEGNNKFVKLAFELVEHFKVKLYPLFDSKFNRNFPTVWSTLGYFDHRDFKINEKFADTFDKFKSQANKDKETIIKNRNCVLPLKIEIDKLSLVEFSYKDLTDAQILKEYEL